MPNVAFFRPDDARGGAVRWIACLWLAGCVFLGCWPASPQRASAEAAPGLTLVQVTQSHMGLPVTLRVYAEDPEAGRRACGVVFARVAELNQVFSSYEPESELSRLVRRAGQGPVPVSDELFAVLRAAHDLAERSAGLLDPTAAPLVRLWRDARRSGRRPTASQIEAARALVGYDLLVLNAEHRTAELAKLGMGLDLGAIAKGHVGDRAVAALREAGLPRAMFEAGGDMVFGDAPPGEAGWPVRPDLAGWPQLRLANTALAVSGDTEQSVVIGGRRYGHVVDPRTGEPIPTRRACLVTAATGLVADPLATLGTLMPEDAFHALTVTHHPGATARLAVLGGEPSTSTPHRETTP